MFGIWTIVPPILAVVIALLSKNVIMALFIGMCSISIMTSGWGFLAPIGEHIVKGIGGNGDVLISFIPIGIMLWFMQKAGGFKAIAKWAEKKSTLPIRPKA